VANLGTVWKARDGETIGRMTKPRGLASLWKSQTKTTDESLTAYETHVSSVRQLLWSSSESGSSLRPCEIGIVSCVRRSEAVLRWPTRSTWAADTETGGLVSAAEVSRFAEASPGTVVSRATSWSPTLSKGASWVRQRSVRSVRRVRDRQLRRRTSPRRAHVWSLSAPVDRLSSCYIV